MQTRQICASFGPFPLSLTRALAAGLAWGLLALSPAQASDVLVVDASGAGAHTTIQAAVDASVDGDMILVRAGTYTEEVTLDARALTVVADGPVTIAGHLFVRNLPSNQVLLLSGLNIAPPSGLNSGPSLYGALDARNCDGQLRVQDCTLTGAYAEGNSPFDHPGAFYGGGPGALIALCADTAFVDCELQGGLGSFAVVAPGAAGGPGLWASYCPIVALVRCLVEAGDGGGADDPGSGGNGVRIEGTTDLYVANSLMRGGDAGCYSGVMGSPGWATTGGNGLVHGGGTFAWDFAGTFAGGIAAFVDLCATPSGNAIDGLPDSGFGDVQTINGYPNVLKAPAIVRDGQSWELTFGAQAGESLRLFHAGGTTFHFSPSFEQPRLIGGVGVRRFPGTFPVPASEEVILPFPPLALPPTVNGYVHWFQGFVTDSGGGKAFTSPRAIIFLNAGF